MLDFIKLNSEEYTLGKKFLFEYTSEYYYDLNIKSTENSWAFNFELKKLDNPIHKSSIQEIFTDYKSNLQVYLALIHTEEVGIISFNHLKWNNCIRIWDFYVKKEYQGRDIGENLLKFAEKEAKNKRIRALVIETQTSNIRAIKFLQKHGFTVTGFDSMNYSNKDIENKDVRIEMGKKFNF